MNEVKPVPFGWRKVTFGEIACFKNGANFKALDFGYEYKMLGVGDFQNRLHLSDSDSLKMVLLSSKPSDGDFLKKDDLVFVRSNGSKELVGRCLCVQYEPKDLLHSGFCIRARIGSNIAFSQYIHYVIQNGLLKKQLVKDGRGTNISNLNQGILSKLSMSLPSLAKQKAIINMLSTWDDAIEKLERLIGAKEMRFRWLIDSFADPSFQYSEEIQNNCNIYRLSELGEFFRGKGIKKSDLKVSGSSCVRYADIYTKYNYLVHSTNAYIDEQTTSSSKLIKTGDIVFATSGETRQEIAKCIAYLGKDKSYSGGDTVVFRPNKHNSRYLGFMLNSTHANRQKVALAQGDSIVHIYMNDLAKISLPIPDCSTQKTIADLLQKSLDEIELLRNLLIKIKQQKRGLMQKLLTGKWRI
ncbi:restriction endonuclease subunit S [bacterium]|nr:restriction endonuclease subunit S [bacterium]